MKSKWETIYEIISEIDMFGTEPKLKIKNSDSFSTHLGVLLSLLYIFSFLSAAAYFGLNLWDVSNPQITYSVVNQYMPPHINFDQSNFTFAFALEDQKYNQFIDESIYKAEVVQITGEKSAETDLTFNWYEEILEIEPCSLQKFPSSYQAIVSGLPLNNMYCLKNSNFSVEGTFLNPSYTSILIKLSTCNQVTSKVKCKSQEEIDEMLKGTYFTFAYTDITIDPTNYTVPNQKYAGDSYTTVSNKFYKAISHYQKIVNVNTDEGWFITDINKKQYVQTDYIKEMIDFRQSAYFMEYTFKLSTKAETYGRTYPKIQDVMAQIGGILQFIEIVCTLIVKNYNTSKFYELLSNELFYIKEDDTDTSKRTSIAIEDNKSKLNLSLNPNNLLLEGKTNVVFNIKNMCKDDNNENNDNNDNNYGHNHIHDNLDNISESVKIASVKVDNDKRDKSIIKTQMIEKRKNNSNDVNMEIIEHQLMSNTNFPFTQPFCHSFWLHLFPCCFKNNHRIKLLNKSSIEIDERIDIINILKNMYDLNRLKFLILNNDQLKLFKLPHKSLISLKKAVPQSRRRGSSVLKNNFFVDEDIQVSQKLKKVKSAYLTVKHNSGELNEKLLNLLNEEYKMIFERE